MIYCQSNFTVNPGPTFILLFKAYLTKMTTILREREREREGEGMLFIPLPMHRLTSVKGWAVVVAQLVERSF